MRYSILIICASLLIASLSTPLFSGDKEGAGGTKQTALVKGTSLKIAPSRANAASDAGVQPATPDEKSATLSKPTKKTLPPDPETETIKFLLERKFPAPLSISEAIRLTRNTVEILQPKTDKFKEPRKEKALYLLVLISDYVKLADDRVSSLPSYRWYYIGRHRVTSESVEEDIFTPLPVLQDVSAISFEATKADVLIHYMKVIDIRDNETNFKINKWIIAGLPRKEVCFLYFPTAIKRIVLDYATRANSWARLKVYVGVTDYPECGKASLYYLSRAKKAIVSDQFPEAVSNLNNALGLLFKFKQLHGI